MQNLLQKQIKSLEVFEKNIVYEDDDLFCQIFWILQCIVSQEKI